MSSQAPTPKPDTRSSRIGLMSYGRDRFLKLRRAGKRASNALQTLTPSATPITVIEPVPPTEISEEERSNRLLRMSPFAIGFLGTMGGLIALFLWGAVQQVGPILTMVVVGLFLALGLNPIVESMTRRGLPRGLAVAVVALAAIGILATAIWAVIPLVVEQSTTLTSNAPHLIEQLRSNKQVARLDARFDILSKISAFLQNGTMWSTIFGGILGTGKVVAGAVFSTFVTTILTFFFLASLPQIKELIYQLAPASRRPRARYLADEIFRRVGGYLSGMFIVATLQASAAFIMINVIGLGRYALALAFIVAVLAFIPLVGSPTAMILIAFVSLTSLGWVQAVIVIVFFLLYQQLEAYVILPHIMRRSVNVPAAITVLSALAGGTLLGAVGALLAVPTAAVILLLYREVVIPALDRS
ncbi:MAG: AI-2E family transporter [Propionibacteriaceae bacterium]